MVNASYATILILSGLTRRLMMNKSLPGDGEESSGKDFYGFRAVLSRR
jgi:hypothetical protein